MDRENAFMARAQAELDADLSVAALRRRARDPRATERELRALRGAWAFAALRALWRAAVSEEAARPSPLPMRVRR